MVFAERVGQAQTVAKRELRNALEKGNKKGGFGRGHKTRGGGKRGRDDMDREQG